jgi:hypothetical protein
MKNKYPVFKKFDPPFFKKIKKNKRKIKSFVFKGLGDFFDKILGEISFFHPGLRPGEKKLCKNFPSVLF